MPSIEYSRRSLLRTVGLLALTPVTGCLQSNESASPTTDTKTERTETTIAESQSNAQQPELQYHDFGEWYRSGDIRYTVTDWGLYSSFRRDDDDTRYEFTDRRLLLADAKAENATDEATGLHAPYFAALVNGNSYRETGHVEHPDLPDRISIADLRRVEHAARWAPQSVSVDPHSTRKFSIVCSVPEEVTLDALEIGYERPEADMVYPVRWVPK